MTIITLDEDIKLKKNHFKNIKELNLAINFVWKTRKLSPKKLIKKFNLDKKYVWEKINIMEEVNNISYKLEYS
jgi:hypothetical protein